MIQHHHQQQQQPNGGPQLSPRSSLPHAEHAESDDGGQPLSGDDAENDYDDQNESLRNGKRKRPISVSYAPRFSLSYPVITSSSPPHSSHCPVLRSPMMPRHHGTFSTPTSRLACRLVCRRDVGSGPFYPPTRAEEDCR